MNIGLVDVDSHNMPNLALMKISAFHKMIGDDVSWVQYFMKYDKVYISKIFTNSIEPQEVIRCDKIIKGGSGYDLHTNLPVEIEEMFPDYTIYPNYPDAIGYLSRGCSRNCGFCIVFQKEGSSHKVANLDRFWNGQKQIRLLDPNLLECKDKMELLQQLADSKSWIHFSQGLDIRLINSNILDALIKIKVKKFHFAWDEMKNSEIVLKNLNLFMENSRHSRNNTSCYVLVNYNTTLEEDFYRLYKLRGMNITPYVMIYDKHNLPDGSIYYAMQSWTIMQQYFWVSDFDRFCMYKYGKTRYDYKGER